MPVNYCAATGLNPYGAIFCFLSSAVIFSVAISSLNQGQLLEAFKIIDETVGKIQGNLARETLVKVVAILGNGQNGE